MQPVILILAAGRASRMGLAKQLLPWRGSTLVGHVARRAVAVPDAAVYLITGAYSDEVEKEVNDLKIRILYNPNYNLGLGGSLSFGVRQILEAQSREPSRILVQLADQPAVTTEYLNELLSIAADEDVIVATAYGKRAGVPAVFPANCFGALADLGGDAGAGPLLNSGDVRVRLIHPAFDLFDIDTPEDYHRHEGNT